jgi:hypothetical protein
MHPLVKAIRAVLFLPVKEAEERSVAIDETRKMIVDEVRKTVEAEARGRESGVEEVIGKLLGRLHHDG